MTEPTLSVFSAKARELAFRLVRRESCSVTEIVVRALEFYENRDAEREPAASFYARLAAQGENDIDLEALIKEDRKKHSGIDL